MSKKLLATNDKRQPSLLGFVSKKSAFDDATKSPSVFGAFKPSQRLLTENGQSATSTPSTKTAVAAPKSKFKYVPVKRKSESLIEISDDSRSPTKMESPASKRVHRLISDDDIFDFDTETTKKSSPSVDDDDVEKRLAAIYAKYDTPKKQQPVTLSTVSLTPKDKLDLDKALSLNDAYVNAQKKLEENLQQVQQSTLASTTRTGVGKFKYNRPRASLNETGAAGADIVSARQLMPTSAVLPQTYPVAATKPVATVNPSTIAASKVTPVATVTSSSVSTSKPRPVATVTSISTESMSVSNVTGSANDTPALSHQRSMAR